MTEQYEGLWTSDRHHKYGPVALAYSATLVTAVTIELDGRIRYQGYRREPPVLPAIHNAGPVFSLEVGGTIRLYLRIY